MLPSPPSPASLPQSDIFQRFPKKRLQVSPSTLRWELGGGTGGDHFSRYCLHPCHPCSVLRLSCLWHLGSLLLGTWALWACKWLWDLPRFLGGHTAPDYLHQIYGHSGPRDRVGVGQMDLEAGLRWGRWELSLWVGLVSFLILVQVGAPPGLRVLPPLLCHLPSGHNNASPHLPLLTWA